MADKKNTLRFIPTQAISRLVFNQRMPDDAVRRILTIVLMGGEDANELPPAEEVVASTILDEVASYDARYKKDIESHRKRQMAYRQRLKYGVTSGYESDGGVTGSDGHSASETGTDESDGGTERNGTDVPNIRGTISPPPPKGGDRVTVTRFKAPTIKEVEDYIVERGGPLSEAPRFVDHYEANGWKTGRVGMKDWRAALRNWLRSAQEFAAASGPAKKISAAPAQPQDPLVYRGPEDPRERAERMRQAAAESSAGEGGAE